MNSREFHEVNKYHFSNLSKLGFKKKGHSRWWLVDPAGKGIELAIRMNSYGWSPVHGSSFMYELLPIYKNKIVHFYLAEQIRVFELKRYDPEIYSSAAIILDRFSSKLPIVDHPLDDALYTYLKSPWNEDKVKQHCGDWYQFYDAADIEDWHTVCQTSLNKVIFDTLDEFNGRDFNERNHKNLNDYTKVRMTINSESN